MEKILVQTINPELSLSSRVGLEEERSYESNQISFLKEYQITEVNNETIAVLSNNQVNNQGMLFLHLAID